MLGHPVCYVSVYLVLYVGAVCGSLRKGLAG